MKPEPVTRKTGRDLFEFFALFVVVVVLAATWSFLFLHLVDRLALEAL